MSVGAGGADITIKEECYGTLHEVSARHGLSFDRAVDRRYLCVQRTRPLLEPCVTHWPTGIAPAEACS